MITGTWMEGEKYQMHGQVFTRFILLNERPPDGKKHGPGTRLTRNQTTSRTDSAWPDMWKHMSDAAKKKPKLDNARQ